MSGIKEARMAHDYAMVLHLDAEIARLKEKRASHVDALLEAVGHERGKHAVPGGGSFTVSENNVYSDAVMERLLRPGQRRLVEVKRIDRAKVRALYPEDYAEAKDNRGVKVTF